MATSSTDFPARGNLVRAEPGAVVFNPVSTNYELRLASPPGYAGPVAGRVDGLVRATARKLWTVAGGGNFVAPIFGPPRVVQGRVRHLDQAAMVVSCGLMVVVTLPSSDAAFDLAGGGLAVGSLVNVALMPGASFEPTAAPTAAAAPAATVG